MNYQLEKRQGNPEEALRPAWKAFAEAISVP
jgi:hypothetical protein